MSFYSLHNPKNIVSFKEACLLGQSPEGGLFFPVSIPKWHPSFIEDIKRKPLAEVGLEVMKPYIGNSISETVLYEIVEETLAFDIPIKKINDAISTLELFHGPTMAFKDVGARFLSRCLKHFSKDVDRELVVLVATSGDTGGAVADGFSGIENVKVVILYPSKKISTLQEKQLCDPANNIYTLEIDGTFDDCQSIVKQAFKDQNLQSTFYLSSANSINVGRWLPQQLYYVEAFKQWQSTSLPPLCVPSGNLGNLCAGMLAQKSGLPIEHFIAAFNINDAVVQYINGVDFEPKKAIATISNAMDIGSPNNFVRLLALCNNEDQSVRNKLSAYSINDEDTLTTIQNVFQQYNYLLDPHGAVGYNALSQYLKQNPKYTSGIFLETAHPIKFTDTVEQATNTKIPKDTEKIQNILSRDKNSIALAGNFEAFKAWLIHSI